MVKGTSVAATSVIRANVKIGRIHILHRPSLLVDVLRCFRCCCLSAGSYTVYSPVPLNALIFRQWESRGALWQLWRGILGDLALAH